MRRQYKLLLAWGVAIFLGSLLYLFSEYHDIKEVIFKDVKRELGHAAQAVKYILPEGFHEQIHKYNLKTIPLAIDDKNIRLETEYARERGIRFLYSFTKQGTNIIFTSTSIGYTESLEEPEVRYGFVYSEASDRLKDAFNRTGFSFEECEDRWGKFFAVYFTREEGGKKWVAGSEYGKDLFEDRVKEAMFKSIRKLGFVLLFFCIPYILAVILFRKDLILLEDEITLLQERYSKELRRGAGNNGR